MKLYIVRKRLFDLNGGMRIGNWVSTRSFFELVKGWIRPYGNDLGRGSFE